MIEGYRIELARRDQIIRLQAIELAAAKQFPLAVLPAEVRDQALPLEKLMEAQTSGQLWIAVNANGQPVGFAMASLCGKVALLDEVDVHPHHQRCGLGRALVQTVIAWASTQALSGIALTTFLEIPWNAPFYQRLGFRVLARDATPEWLARQLEHEETLGLRGRVAMQFSFPSPAIA